MSSGKWVSLRGGLRVKWLAAPAVLTLKRGDWKAVMLREFRMSVLNPGPEGEFQILFFFWSRKECAACSLGTWLRRGEWDSLFNLSLLLPRGERFCLVTTPPWHVALTQAYHQLNPTIQLIQGSNIQIVSFFISWPSQIFVTVTGNWLTLCLKKKNKTKLFLGKEGDRSYKCKDTHTCH